jgi:HEAT repeat protein
VADLLTEVGKFRAWADAYPHPVRNGEWECDYDSWASLYDAVLGFVADRPFDSWSSDELQSVLYTIARDNEMQHLAREVRRRHPELLLPLSRAAVRLGEREDRWQLAVELGSAGSGGEQVLLEMAHDEYEYVRRRALESLAKVGSPAVEELALAAWHRPDEDQEHARMMVLHCLDYIGSPQLEPLLAEAERDGRQYLRQFAQGLRPRRSPEKGKQTEPGATADPPLSP